MDPANPKARLQSHTPDAPVAPGVASFHLPPDSRSRGVIVTDAEHRIQFSDSRIADLLGVNAADLVGKDLIDMARTTLKHRFLNPDEFERRSEWLLQNPTETAEDVMELVEPTRRILHRYSTPLLDSERNPVGRIEVYSDITKRRQLEETNASLYKEMASAYEELKATQHQLLQSEKLRVVGEIASGVAHDFNNTLGIILGNIQLLLRTVDDDKTRSRLQSIEQAALDGAETVRRIQEFTKIQPDKPLSPLDLSALATEVVNVMGPTWEKEMQARDCRIEVGLGVEQGVYAVGIAPEIREVLANILLNAVQAMPQGGRVVVSTGISGDAVWVKVEDTGTGMSEDVRKRVFDPFFTTKGVKGAGLGMSVAYGIIKRHNGRISVESRLGEGTTVCISLPAAGEVSEIERTEVPTDKPVIAPARILVVDDEEMFAQVFVEMLSECGHAVCVARNGMDAIEQFRNEPFDLVFTDLGMPEMSGWQVAKSIKDMDPQTPVVLLTGWGTTVDEDRLNESRIDMVLSKPVDMGSLAGVVSRVLTGDQAMERRIT